MSKIICSTFALGSRNFGHSATLIMTQIACAGEPPDVPGHLSPGLRDLSLRCLELEPCLRPSARDLLLHPVLQAGRPAEKIALIFISVSDPDPVF
jgi:hypothetical protein